MLTTRQTSFFGPVPPRDAAMAEYLQFLARRDGVTAPQAAFPPREAWLAAADASPVRYAGAVDQGQFERGFGRFDASEVSSPELRALLAFVKINAGEAYGVEAVGRARHQRPETGDTLDRVERLLIKEEEYHTRILLGAAHQFGLAPPKAAYRPPLGVKLLIGALVHAPSPFFHPVLLAAEVGGLFTFNWLLERVAKVYADQPELRDGLEARLIEIIIDEIGHVAFNRVAVGPLGLAVGRRLAPEVAHATSGHLRELLALGWSRADLDAFGTFTLESLPEVARRRAFFA